MFHIHKRAPWLRMIGKALHKRSITVPARMGASHVWIHCIFCCWNVRLRYDALDIYIFNYHLSLQLLVHTISFIALKSISIGRIIDHVE